MYIDKVVFKKSWVLNVLLSKLIKNTYFTNHFVGAIIRIMTEKMELFCLEYMKDFNATQAALRAGYSKRTARSIGSENLAKPDIKERIDELKQELISDKDKIILENLLFWQKMRDSSKEKSSDRIKASENLGRYVAMFKDRIDIDAYLKVEEVEPVSLEDLESQIIKESPREE